MSNHPVNTDSVVDTGTAPPRLPQSFGEWLRVFGPGAIIASVTIGSGELIFSTRGGALFGYDILYLFVFISILKWGLVLATSRHIVLTGVHPYERMLSLPGPRGWYPLMLLLMMTFVMPVWITFFCSVLGNLSAYVLGLQGAMNGGIDYVLGGAILIGLLILSALGGYSVLEKVQIVLVAGLVGSAFISLILLKPDWFGLLGGVVPRPLSLPDWARQFAEFKERSVWVETTLYVGVIGGAAHDYLAYTSWAREKKWGRSANRVTPTELQQIADDPQHEARRWLKAPLVDCSVSFTLIVLFSAVFVAAGAIVLAPQQVIPDENNMLNLQEQFFTKIHRALLPLYVAGAFMTILGTQYGTIEMACTVFGELFRSCSRHWTPEREPKFRRLVVAHCAVVSLAVLAWLIVRQTSGGETPKIVLDKLLTPVNLFTGVLHCGIVCLVMIWIDRRFLPRSLQPPRALIALNIFSGFLFVALGLKGYWDHSLRWGAILGILGLAVLAVLLAAVFGSLIIRDEDEPVPESQPDS